MKYLIKVYKKGKMAQMSRTKKIRKFLKNARLINFKNNEIKAYLKVDYGRYLDVYGKMINFDNEGTYDNKEDFLWAVDTFTEE